MGDQIEQAAKSEELKSASEELKSVFIEAVAGAIMFIVVACVAVGLGFFVKVLKTIGVDPVIVYGLTIFEYFLFFIDIFLAVLFICKKVIKHLRGGKI